MLNSTNTIIERSIKNGLSYFRKKQRVILLVPADNMTDMIEGRNSLGEDDGLYEGAPITPIVFQLRSSDILLMSRDPLFENPVTSYILGIA